MQILNDLLARCDISNPDGRALHAYGATPEEVATLRRLLPKRIDPDFKSKVSAQAFVLWVCEHIRTTYTGGQITWEYVYGGLGLKPPDYLHTQWLVETGLAAWRRKVRRGDSGHREFLYTLVAEGGLPDAALAEANRYGTVLLKLILELEAEGALAPVAAAFAAKRQVAGLPQALRHEEQARLLADLALGLVDLRSALPNDIPADSALAWLDAQRPGWRSMLPLRMSARALEALVRPALLAPKMTNRRVGAPVQRELRKDADGIWRGVARVVDGGLLPLTLLPQQKDRRLRLTACSGAAFLAQPDVGGWRLSRTSGTGLLALAPDEPVVLSAHVDGAWLGEVVVDAGSPSATEAPALWHPADCSADDPDLLLPLSGRGHTRAPHVWLLTAAGVVPLCDPGIQLGSSAPAPGGRIWRLSGQGRVLVDGHTLTIATGAASDSPVPQLAVFGTILPGLTTTTSIPVFLGEPQILGAEGDTPLRVLGSHLRQKRLTRTLGGIMAEWVEDGAVLARVRIIALPQQTRFSTVEIGNGALRVTVSGLPRGWHMSVTAGEAVSKAVILADRAILELKSSGTPGFLRVGLSDPASGATLNLTGLWPARQPRLLDPGDTLLTHDREISLASLAGWRGYFPGQRGAILLRVASKTRQIGLHATGDLRLAGMTPLISQALALAGADGRVNLQLADGIETPRLSIKRYDWTSEVDGSFRHLGAGLTRLQAVDLEDPARTSETVCTGRIDLRGWLGCGAGLWFVQAQNDARGVMRPFVWAEHPQPFEPREARLERYAAIWADLLEAPADLGWDRVLNLIATVRAAGDPGALDQVQALERVPGAAVALLFMADRADRATTLSLETEAPLWLPLLSCRAWAQGARAARARIVARLADAGIQDDEISAKAMARAAGEIVLMRPELAAHLGQALVAAGLQPIALNAHGQAVPLAAPASRLQSAAQEAGRRFDMMPQGTDGLRAAWLALPAATNDANAILMNAPLVTAEVSAGLRPSLNADDTLRLIAIRAIDPIWFDAALPAALTIALEMPVPTT